MFQSLARAFKEATQVASQQSGPLHPAASKAVPSPSMPSTSSSQAAAHSTMRPPAAAAAPAGHASHSSAGGKPPTPNPVLAPPVAAAATAASTVADSRQAKLSLCGWELEGVSISGQETCIIVPRAKVAFDIGRCPQRACFQQTVLLSHTHLDHVGGLPFHVCTRAMQGLPASRVVVPQGRADGVRQLVEVAVALQDCPPLEWEVAELQAGCDMTLPSGLLCRAFPTTHTIPSQGYVLYSQRRKLRADLQGLSQDEIRQRRLAGEEVTDTFQVPEIAFTGDTTAAFLEEQQQQQQQACTTTNGARTTEERGDDQSDGSSAPNHGNDTAGGGGRSCTAGAALADALRARLLIMELTFLDDVGVDEAREKGHMHIADFVAHAHRFQNEAILLTHFSPRYKRSRILEALDTLLPPGLRAKCVPLLNGIE